MSVANSRYFLGCSPAWTRQNKGLFAAMRKSHCDKRLDSLIPLGIRACHKDLLPSRVK
jgi:hypothetical protein